ncbi:MAG: arylamine N-acetyltransferase [Clostridia bacterium]|nr:arylamine N-acetyltransferase [Clostridia bacterium]
MTKLEKFFMRIGMEPDTEIEFTTEFLGRVQTNSVLHIAYENLDILDHKPIILTPDAMYEKIVLRGRGGYCFELNGFLTAMLRVMGFTVTERFARYLRGESEVPMRRHRVCVVTLEDGDYMLDIGVGQIAPRLPLKIEEGLIQEQNGETYKFLRDAEHGWVLWDMYHGDWREYICFTDDKAIDVDFVQPSFFCEAHPDSVFNKEPMIAIKTEDGRRTIDGRVYKEFIGEKLVCIEEDISDARMADLLENAFKLTPNP